MISSFSLQNICGTLYQSGNLIFNTTRNILYSSVGNRIKVIDLVSNITSILPIQTRSNIDKLCLSNDSNILIAIDLEGYSIIINLNNQTIISHFNFKQRLSDIKFSPDGKFLAISYDLSYKIFEAPTVFKNYEALTLFKKFKNQHSDMITGLVWSPDSRFLVTLSKDLTAKMHCIFHLENYVPFVFATHKNLIKQAYFSQDMKYFYSIDKYSVLCVWKWVDDYLSENYKKHQEYELFKRNKKIKLNDDKEKVIDLQDEALKSKFEKNIHTGRFIMDKKEKFFLKNLSKLKCAFFKDNLLFLAYQNGHFMMKRIHEDEIQGIQSFQLNNQKINTISINFSSAWIAFGIKENGQLMVWEWRSQTYIINQQCLSNDITCCSYSKDGSVIATGGNDGKIRIWDQISNLCLSSMQTHNGKINGLQFTIRPNTLLACSVDGTISCSDTLKFKTFRKLKPDLPTQFICVTSDVSGEMAIAGGIDPYDICSWDKTLRVHDIFSKQLNSDILDHNSEITAISVKQNGQHVACATLKGEIYIWDYKNVQIIVNIDIKRDVGVGKGPSRINESMNTFRNKYFTSITFSADGEYLLGGGKSKYVCLYELNHRILLKKFLMSDNRSLEGVVEFKNSSKKETDVIEQESDSDKKDQSYLPGSKNSLISKRKLKLNVETRQIEFSPSEDSFIIASSKGLVIFKQGTKNIFTPYQLDEEVNIDTIKQAFQSKDYIKALNLAIIYDDFEIMSSIYQNIPRQNINQIIQSIPIQFLENFLKFIASEIQNNNLIELNFEWLERLLFQFNQQLQTKNSKYLGTLKNLIKQVNLKMTENMRVADQNIYSIDFLLNQMELKVNKIEQE